jgi:hypothetical protein
MAEKKNPAPTRDTVFVPGGQPTVTYVARAQIEVEKSVARAISTPNQVISICGPTKSGKTVLCRKILNSRPTVWIEGGQIESASDIWDKICWELNYPAEISKTESDELSGELSSGVPLIASAKTSTVKEAAKTKIFKIDSMAAALRHLQETGTVLVIDDFHYLSDETRTKFLRNIKGAIFQGLKLILLSVTVPGYQ